MKLILHRLNVPFNVEIKARVIPFFFSHLVNSKEKQGYNKKTCNICFLGGQLHV